jgi:hypothetical protein
MDWMTDFVVRKLLKVISSIDNTLLSLKDQVARIVKDQDATDKQRDPSPSTPITIGAITGLPVTVTKYYESNTQTQWSKRLKTLIEIAAIGAAFWLAWLNHDVLVEIRKQTPELRKAAEAAKSAAGTAKVSLEAVQRAFVTFDQMGLDATPTEIGGPATQWMFYAMVENSGTTPAIDKVQFFAGSNALSAEPSEAEFIGTIKERRVGGEIGPKARKNVGLKITGPDFILGRFPFSSINTAEFHKFFTSRRIVFWGWISYRDVFQEAPHLTEFCQQVTGVGMTDKGLPTIPFKECDAHNCTDEHCDDYQQITSLVMQTN